VNIIATQAIAGENSPASTIGPARGWREEWRIRTRITAANNPRGAPTISGLLRPLKVNFVQRPQMWGASTLIVSPSGESLLVDTANRTPDDRDAKRIMVAVQQAD
jgi:hypothetical protein